MNGVTLVSGQPITTTGAALTLGDIPAAAFYGGQQSGADGMFFDDYYVAAGPSPVPQILLAPKSQTVAAGSTMALGVIASGDPSLSYQWYFNSTLIPGATSPGMWLSNPAPASAGNYSVVVSNSDGHASASATVAVTGSAGAALLSAPISEGTNGRLVKLQVTANNSYHVLASTNLASWAAIGAFFANGSNTTFLDGAAATLPRRYYRLVSP